MVVPDPIPTFYADVPVDLADACVSHLVPQSHETTTQPTRHEGWRDIPITYVLCKNDAAVFTEAIQRPTVALLQEQGSGDLEVIELESSHSPFLSQPERCGEVIGEAIKA